MVSVDKFPDWSVFQQRETLVPTDDFSSPAAEVATVLRAAHAKQEAGQQALRELEWRSFVELAQQAVRVVQLGKLLEDKADAFLSSSEAKQARALAHAYKSLQINQKQMLDALKKAGLEIEIPLHKTYAEVAENVEIEEWRHHQDFTEEIVVDVKEPIVRRGSLIRAGRVIMGAPLSAQPLETPHVRKDEVDE